MVQRQKSDTTSGSDNVSLGEGKDAAKISAQEEADLSSALIAQLLAEDSAGGNYASYYDDYGNAAACGDAGDEYVSGSEPDEDWDPNLKRRRKSKGSKPRKAASSACVAEEAAVSSSDSDRPKRPKKSRAAPKKEKPAPAPVTPGQYRSGAYTDEEELKFNEGLELFGRSWSGISEHVVTRDAKSIRSHAQKYFIKLFRDSIPLPAKVRESGEGYTLSGRPLDPNSAAARPYLQHVMQLDPPAPKPPKAAAKSLGPPETVIVAAADVKLADSDAAPSNAIETVQDSSKADDGDDTSQAPAADSIHDSSVIGNNSSQSADPTATNEADIPDALADLDHSASAGDAERDLPELKATERTEYAKSRPQRNHVRPVALRYKDPHQMVRCTPFAGQPLSKVAGSQPFRLVVHTNAQLEMDFHAHLMLSEVIGLLGGCWDAKERVLTVTRAFPCQALDTDDAHTNVEMDPGSELVVRHQIVDAGLCVVGWYHSHPTFRPDPSIIDIENQTAYQALFRDNDSSEEPFVGAIVGPYDPELPGPVSVFNWFYVGRSAIDRGHPKRLMVEVASDASLSETEQDILLQLLDSVNGAQHHAPLEEAWRPSSTEMRSLKMAVSLAHRMPWLACSKDSPGPVTPVELAKAEIPVELANTEIPVDSAKAEAVTADNASDCTVTDAGDDVDKRILPAHALAGQNAVQDPFLAALCRRFTAGVFKANASGDVANSQALARVFAAYFMQWSSA
ncbi:hypothetical protein GGH14_002092 [Coemansia sp. RSA 370]|nr:hypothetical protein GGH14_002092 [Coemansia sp. RSA 370]